MVAAAASGRVYGENKLPSLPPDSIGMVCYADSLKQVRLTEVDFIVASIENSCVWWKRGIRKAEGQRAVKAIYEKVERLFCYYNQYP